MLGQRVKGMLLWNQHPRGMVLTLAARPGILAVKWNSYLTCHSLSRKRRSHPAPQRNGLKISWEARTLPLSLPSWSSTLTDWQQEIHSGAVSGCCLDTFGGPTFYSKRLLPHSCMNKSSTGIDLCAKLNSKRGGKLSLAEMRANLAGINLSSNKLVQAERNNVATRSDIFQTSSLWVSQHFLFVFSDPGSPWSNLLAYICAFSYLCMRSISSTVYSIIKSLRFSKAEKKGNVGARSSPKTSKLSNDSRIMRICCCYPDRNFWQF